MPEPTFRYPDDPGAYARTCLRCGLDEGLGAQRMCHRCDPPAPWWAHMLRLVDERALLLRVARRVKRALVSFDAWLGGEP